MPDADSVYAYDAMRLLMAAIAEAGPDRQRVMAALRRHRSSTIECLAGTMRLDGHLNNITEPKLVRVVKGRLIVP
jgi:ABC-type branched-subunit amino acid transport system substrate-binding protein